MSPVVGHWLHHVDFTLDLKSEAPSYCDLTATHSSLRGSDSLPLTFPFQWCTAYFSRPGPRVIVVGRLNL
jgi:hypothetical protein